MLNKYIIYIFELFYVLELYFQQYYDKHNYIVIVNGKLHAYLSETECAVLH